MTTARIEPLYSRLASPEGGAALGVDDLDLDRSLSRVGSDVESLDGLFQGESVGDQRLEVDQSCSDESDGLGVLWSSSGKVSRW
jgi:hypothetical protein